MVNKWWTNFSYCVHFLFKHWHVLVYFWCIPKASPISIYDIFINFRKRKQCWEKEEKENTFMTSSVKVSFYFPLFFIKKELMISIFFSQDCFLLHFFQLQFFHQQKYFFLVCVIFFLGFYLKVYFILCALMQLFLFGGI